MDRDDPCFSRVARRAEVLAACDTWKAECDALADRLGLPDAEARANAAYVVVERLDKAIMAFRPSTLTGFVLKAKWIQKEQSAAPLADQLVVDLCAHGHAA